MKGRHTRLRLAVLIGALLGAQASTETWCAEGTNAAASPAAVMGATDANTLEIIKQLQRRIDELEQKVKALGPILTESQLESYRHQQALEAQIVGDMANKIIGRGTH